VVRRGYKLRDRVLRPALVAVAAAPEGGGHDPTAGSPGAPSTDGTHGPGADRAHRPTN
jgi:hypothetical protein